jgi:hypothetical protein
MLLGSKTVFPEIQLVVSYEMYRFLHESDLAPVCRESLSESA